MQDECAAPENELPARDEPRLLGPGEPLPFRVLNASSKRPLLLVCDHASRRFPESLGDLGLDPVARTCHLAWDIGAGPLTERVATELGVTTVLAEYSRLIVDCNRDLVDPSAFLEFGDGIVIHGNRGLDQRAKDQRAQEIYWPYHYAIDMELKRLAAIDYPPALISIHSFTPVLDGVSRHWEIGVLWDADRATAEIVIDGFRAAGYDVGDNEPYSGKAPMDFTIDHHAEAANLPHVGIEIRHDLIASDDGVEKIGALLAGIVDRITSGERLRAAGEDSYAPA